MKFMRLNSKQQKNKSQKIKFTTNRVHLSEESNSCPKPTSKTMPSWYKNADIYAVDPQTNKPWINPIDGGKMPTWKACPAILDVMSSGYVLRTPCDIEVYNSSKRIMVKMLDKKCQDFVHLRDPMPQFVPPLGYDENHFSWWMDWCTEVPKGYSVLYTHPMNRFDLPFFSTSGIIDNDKVTMPGTLPFFVFKGWTGIIPAGTPYIQLLPFRRENWSSEIIVENPLTITKKNILNAAKYRVKDGGVYKNEVWERRSYK